MDQATNQWLNLLKSSPNFAIRLGRGDDKPNVKQLSEIPKDDGLYWVFGMAMLKNGDSIPSVFEVDTDSGGSLTGAYFFIKGVWCHIGDKDEISNSLNYPLEDIFPFDWKYAIPLAEDIYHD